MAALSLALPFAAQAAGLGKLTLISALGQPLNAEIEIVSLQPGEEDLAARLATNQAFAQAGIDANPVLSDVRFTIERRGSTPVLRLRSSQPINEPFLELLVELTWSSGRLVREYTFLLDPPEYKTKMAVAATAPAQKPAAAEPKPAPTPPAQAEPQPQGAPPAETKPEAMPAEASPPVVGAAPSTPPASESPAATPTPPPPPSAGTETPAAPPSAAPSSSAPASAPEERAALPREPTVHEVKKGDTLGKIARANLPPGVTLNQMLLALYRANEAAFIRGNVNLVRAGRILNIPDADAVGTIDRAEADRVVKEHMAQFAEYRSRLAAAPTAAEASSARQGAAGVIESKPAAPTPPAAQDQLRLSKAEPTKPGAGSAAREDDAAARQRALSEAQSRQTDLEKNVSDLRKLLEMKNQQLAELEKKAKPAPTPAAPTPPPVPAKPPVEAAKPAPAPIAPAPAPAKPPAEAAKPAPAPVAPTPAPAAAKPPVEAAKPAPAPVKPDAKKAAPQPEAGVVDEFLDNPLYLGLLGGLVLLLVVYAYIAWRRKKAAHAKFQDSVLGAAAAGAGPGTTAPLGTPTAGGGAAAVPAAGAPAVTAAPAAGESEEVDPIAEADVYMAYGRDAQAEEILKEALAKDSKRIPVQAKLLEIYAHRKDAKTFEQTAMKLKQLTDGKGPEWDKAAALGRSIDPQNSIYGGGGEAPAAPVAAAAPAAAAPTLDFDLGGGGAAAQGPASTPDISLDEPASREASAPAMDFDLGGSPAAAKTDNLDQTQVLRKEDAPGDIDFNLDLGGGAPAPEAPKAAPPAETSGGLDFDINLDLGGGDKKAEPAAEKSAPAMDLSAISLDLGGAPASAPSGGGTDPKWQEVATKLDLAKAYEEMGDKDGARELLNEVMKDGDAAQKGTAQQLLAKLG